MSTGQPQHVSFFWPAVFFGQPTVVVAHRGHRARLHLRQAFTAGKHRRAGMGLDHRPQRLLRQLTDLAAGPVPVVHLREAVIDERFEA